MKSFMILAFTLLLSGCSEHPQAIPMNTVERANELCSSMDGVKRLRVITWCNPQGKVCNNSMTTQVSVVCNKHDAKVSAEIEWELVR
jgi:starvation-inducible outer membrane lipoprotein